MKKAEKEILNFLASLQTHEIEITASGLVLISDIDISSYEAARILRNIAEEIKKDNYYNHNIYKINLNNLMEMIQNEESSCVSESE